MHCTADKGFDRQWCIAAPPTRVAPAQVITVSLQAGGPDRGGLYAVKSAKSKRRFLGFGLVLGGRADRTLQLFPIRFQQCEEQDFLARLSLGGNLESLCALSN